MKKILFLIFLIYVNIHCLNAQSDIIGEFGIEMLTKQPYADWYLNEYTSYKPDTLVLSKIEPFIHKDMKMVIVMGTFCSDSKEQVPRFAKILEQLNIPRQVVKYYGIDDSKTIPEDVVKQYEIKFVPTFIFYDKAGHEINRMVEYPIKKLEEDMLEILQLKGYRNPYYENVQN